jgi:hypothetical protein
VRHATWTVRAVLVLALVAAQASARTPGQDDGGWRRVQQIEKGTEVIIGVAGRQPLRYTLLLADDRGVVVVKPTEQGLDEDVLDAFTEVGWGWTEVLAGRPVAKGGFEIRDGGVYRKSKKLMDLAGVVERIDRAAITDVRGAHTQSAGDPIVSGGRGESAKGAVIGALIGLGAWALAASVHASDGCGDGCYTPSVHATPQAGLFAGGLGALIGGLVGWSHREEHSTFYVAPKDSAPTLNDVPWERLRLALPPSLQGAGAVPPLTSPRAWRDR